MREHNTFSVACLDPLPGQDADALMNDPDSSRFSSERRDPREIQRYPVEGNRLFVMHRIQPEIPVAGLSLAQPGHGGSKVVPVSSAPSCSCSKKLNRTAVDQVRPRGARGCVGVLCTFL